MNKKLLNKYDKIFKKHFSKKRCMVSDTMKKDCDKIIKAHTISKSWNMKKIALEGHVYGFKKDFFAKTSEIEEIGVNKASTFNGFCGKHDRELFSCIENDPFVGEKKQFFMLAYRIVAREVYLKLSSIGTFKEILKHEGYNYNMAQFIGTEELSKNDLENNKKFLDNFFKQSDFSKIKHLTIEFDGNPDIMAAGTILPGYAFDGSILQDNFDFYKSTILDPITFTTFTLENSWAFSFIWLENFDKVCIPFVQSFLDSFSDDRKGNAIVRFLYEYCENIFFSPAWWDRLDNYMQQELKKLFEVTVSEEKRYRNILENNRNYVDWKVKGVKKNY